MIKIDLSGKVAIVTGGAQGIGRSIAEVLASAGANVVISDVNISLAEETAREIAAKSAKEIVVVSGDVASYSDCEKIVQTTLEKFAKIDILVNNAGITRDNLILRMSDGEWDAVLNVNLKGAFNCIKATSKVMIKQRQGKIINIASVVGLMGNAGQANYSASKGGLIALTKTAARELASRNITVNAIAPGYIQTKMTEALSEDARQKLVALIPLNRLGTPEDIARTVLFLSSPLADYITGQVISVNGGMYM